MAEFNHDQAPASFEWTTQWKTWLANLKGGLKEFFSSPTFGTTTVDGNLSVQGDGLVDGAFQVTGDVSANDASFSGEITVGEDVHAGGMLVGQNSALHVGPLTLSGSSFTLSSTVPTWARKILVMLNGVSTSGTSSPILQLGISTGPVTSGYNGSVTSAGSGGNDSENHTNGFRFNAAHAADEMLHGTIVLVHMGGNVWSCTINGGRSDATAAPSGGGTVSLGGALTSLTVTSVLGLNQYDAGTISLRFEY